ncbi:hypothetical protein, partial [Rossellomorea sp. RS05]|uniref:hypothetical protein n=1 Tax=Rossellomorea sp. RS05 TaxID=3149166 RepID=UPI0032218E9D
GGSIWGDKHKRGKPKRRSVPLWISQLMTSSPKPPELDKKKSGGGSIWGDKHKRGKPKRRSVPLWISQLMTSSPKPPELAKNKGLAPHNNGLKRRPFFYQSIFCLGRE